MAEREEGTVAAAAFAEYQSKLREESYTEDFEELLSVLAGRVRYDAGLLHLAAQFGRADILELLINFYNLSPLLVDEAGNNVLHTCILHKQVYVARLFSVEFEVYNIDFNFREELVDAPFPGNGRHPLAESVIRKDLEMVQAFVRSTDGLGASCATRKTREIVDDLLLTEISIDSSEDASIRLELLRIARGTDLSFYYALESRLKEKSIDDFRADWEGRSWWKERRRIPFDDVELNTLFKLLLYYIHDGSVPHVNFLIDEFGAKTNPPLARQFKWNYEVLADYAVGHGSELDLDNETDFLYQFYGQDGHRSSSVIYIYNFLMCEWFNSERASAAALVELIEGELAKIEKDEYQRSDDRLKRSLLQRRGTIVGGSSSEVLSPSDSDRIERRGRLMLGALSTRLGPSRGSPRLFFIANKGVVWALQWILRNNDFTLAAPIGSPHASHDDCAICLQPILSPVFLHPCTHKMCRVCVQRWFQEQQQRQWEHEQVDARFTCPLCRADVSETDLLPEDRIESLAFDIVQQAAWLKPPGTNTDWQTSSTPIGTVMAALASKSGCLFMLEFLAEHGGVDLEFRFGGGFNMMHFAVIGRRPEVVAWLLLNGHEILASQGTDDGLLPLHLAAIEGDEVSVHLLYEHGINNNPPPYADDWISTFLDRAKQGGYKDIVSYAQERHDKEISLALLTELTALLAKNATISEIRLLKPRILQAIGCLQFIYDDDVRAWQRPLLAAVITNRIDFLVFVYNDLVPAAYEDLSFMKAENISLNHSLDYSSKDKKTWKDFLRDAAEYANATEILSGIDALAAESEQIMQRMEAKNRETWATRKALQEMIVGGATLEAISAAIRDCVRVRDGGVLAAEGIVEFSALKSLLASYDNTWEMLFRVEMRGGRKGHYDLHVHNAIALGGHRHLLDWAMPCCSADEIVTMVGSCVRHGWELAHPVDFIHLLVEALRSRGHGDLLSNARFDLDCDDDSGRHIGLPGGDLQSSLLELAFKNMDYVGISGIYSDVIRKKKKEETEMDDAVEGVREGAEKAWKVIEHVSMLEPPIPLPYENVCHTIETIGRLLTTGEEGMPCAGTQPFAVLRQTFEKFVAWIVKLSFDRGHDVLAPGDRSKSLVQILAIGGFAEAFRWLALSKGISVQGIPIECSPLVMMLMGPAPEEYRNQIAEIQREQVESVGAG